MDDINKQIGRAIRVHALIEVACAECGGPASRLGTAPISADGRIDVHAAEVIGPVQCNSCCDKEREANVQARKRDRQQARWRNRAMKC